MLFQNFYGVTEKNYEYFIVRIVGLLPSWNSGTFRKGFWNINTRER